jgi:hypothetical protein
MRPSFTTSGKTSTSISSGRSGQQNCVSSTALEGVVMKAMFFGVAALCLLSAQAKAATLNAPLPSNAFIIFDNLEWAWAYPFPPSYPGFDLSYQSQFGWRLPTAAELASAPDATDFLFSGANVPFFGTSSPYSGTDPVSGAYFTAITSAYMSAASAGACATPYFSTLYYNCDFGDGNGQNYTWAGSSGAPVWADQLVVNSVQPAPLPAALPLLATGLGAMGLLGWRRKRKGAAVGAQSGGVLGGK